MKLRCSPGFRVEEYFGTGVPSLTTDEITLSGVDRDASCCFSIRNEANLKDGDPMFFQLAILYTSLPSSQRIVRVHNFMLHTSLDPMVVFRHSDIDCMVTYLCKMAASHALRHPMSIEKPSSKQFVLGGSRRTADIRQRVIDICVDILLNYRQLCSAHSPKGQLILPESLKVLPLYTLCILKHPCFMQNAVVGAVSASGSAGGGTSRLAVDSCERSFALNTMLRASFKEVMFSLYPRMYALHDLKDGDGYPVKDEWEDSKGGSGSRVYSNGGDPDFYDDSEHTFSEDEVGIFLFTLVPEDYGKSKSYSLLSLFFPLFLSLFFLFYSLSLSLIVT